MARVQLVAAWLVTLQLVSTAPTTNTAASDRAALAPVLGKTFRMEHCDNMLATLQAMGVNETLSKITKAFIFTLTLNENNGEYTLTSDSYVNHGNFPIKLISLSAVFHIGQEFETMNFDGETVKTVITQEANTLTEVRSGKNPGTTIRIFTPEQVTTTDKVMNIVNNCVYIPE